MPERRNGFRCFECDLPAECAHHVVPHSRGGTRTIPLCNSCHGKAHGLASANHSELIKEGMLKAKKKGRHAGRPRTRLDKRVIAEFRSRGWSWQAIAERLGVSINTVRREADADS